MQNVVTVSLPHHQHPNWQVKLRQYYPSTVLVFLSSLTIVWLSNKPWGTKELTVTKWEKSQASWHWSKWDTGKDGHKTAWHGRHYCTVRWVLKETGCGPRHLRSQTPSHSLSSPPPQSQSQQARLQTWQHVTQWLGMDSDLTNPSVKSNPASGYFIFPRGSFFIVAASTQDPEREI